jgi:hypothetical protein
VPVHDSGHTAPSTTTFMFLPNPDVPRGSGP